MLIFTTQSDLDSELDRQRIMSGLHGAFATGVACQQGTLTLLDSWLRPPFWDLSMLQLSITRTCHVFTRLFTLNTSLYFQDFAPMHKEGGQFRTSLDDKSNAFDFQITNCLFLSSNNSSSPTYGVFISHLKLYARAWSSYDTKRDFCSLRYTGLKSYWIKNKDHMRISSI